MRPIYSWILATAVGVALSLGIILLLIAADRMIARNDLLRLQSTSIRFEEVQQPRMEIDTNPAVELHACRGAASTPVWKHIQYGIKQFGQVAIFVGSRRQKDSELNEWRLLAIRWPGEVHDVTFECVRKAVIEAGAVKDASEIKNEAALGPFRIESGGVNTSQNDPNICLIRIRFGPLSDYVTQSAAFRIDDIEKWMLTAPRIIENP